MPLLSDIIGIEKKCTIMSDYALGLEKVALRLQSSSTQTLVLMPLNSAISALPQKPWLDVSGDKSDISPQRNDERAATNIQRFVEAHVIDISTKDFKADHTFVSMSGQKLHLTLKEGEKYIQPGNMLVVAEKEAENGLIWVIDGVIDPRAARNGHNGDL